jgi:hypothetical protein
LALGFLLLRIQPLYDLVTRFFQLVLPIGEKAIPNNLIGCLQRRPLRASLGGEVFVFSPGVSLLKAKSSWMQALKVCGCGAWLDQ